MATTAEVYAPVEAPPLVPRPFGLFSVAPPTDGGERWRVGVGMQSYNCMEAGVWNDVCIDGGAVAPKVVTDWLCDTTVFDPFTVYLLTSRTGIDTDVASPELSAAFEGAEQRAVEARLWAEIVAVATDLGGQPSLAYALAVVEGNLATHYNGLGVIHVSPFAATRMADLLEQRDGKLYTKANGTPVVVGAGYGDPDLPTVEIAGTGAVFVRRGEIEALNAWDLSINDINALAERTYLVGWDCYATRSSLTEAP
ncbi:MAG: hypothetical protein ABW122_06165 [Ilumatobacteraceae bacterium]